MTFVGIDVTKLTLDTAANLETGAVQRHQFGNRAAGLAALLAWIDAPGCRIVLEATSSYHPQLLKAPEVSQHHVSVVNHAQVNCFVKSHDRRNKTD